MIGAHCGPRRTGVGMVLGKFMPPHLGHQFLIDFARSYSEQVVVVVGTLASEPIPGALRHAWMRELYPELEVLHLTDENPQSPDGIPDFWEIWERSLKRVLGARRPDQVFASEPYGQKLAEVLGAAFIPVDVARATVPISATRIREDPLAHWAFLPPCVRPYFVRRISIFGPESTGKSTLAAALARRYQTSSVPEYARTLLEAQGGRIAAEDLVKIARGQIAAEEALARQANRLLFCDTDPLATVVWSEALFGAVDPWIIEAARDRRYDLTLLTDVDVPFVPDLVRYLPSERDAFMQRCVGALEGAGRRFVRLSGSWNQRLETAAAAIEALLRGTSVPSRP